MSRMVIQLGILLALLWAFMWGTLAPWVVFSGFIIAIPLLVTVHRLGRDYSPGSWRLTPRLVTFIGYFGVLVYKSNIAVVKVVLSREIKIEPRIFRYSVEGLTDMQITTLANSITLTPGTLSMGISDDRRWLYIHCMAGGDREAAVRDTDDLKNRILQEVC